MIYRNLNKSLNSELIEKCGFHFDGYYYINPLIPVKFVKNGDGFTPSVDANLPQLKQLVLHTYSELIGVLAASMQLYIQNRLKGQNFISQQSQMKFIASCVNDYWKFDEYLSFALGFLPQGLQLVPTNEYTFSLMNGSICKFRVFWEYESESTDEYHTVEFDCHPQCVSKDYLTNVITENKGMNPFIIGGVQIHSEKTDEWIDFYGVGIPKPIQQNSES